MNSRLHAELASAKFFMASTQEEIPTNTDPSAESVLVSVIIPAYNASAYITGTLNSVLAQTFTNYEIIVVNDGSPDTAALEKALEPYLPFIRYIKQENRGPSSARNTGIRAARGKYVAFLDSDDLWLPQHLSRQLELLEKDRSLGLVYANGLYVANDQPFGISFDSTPQSLPVDFEALLAEKATVSTSSTVALRQPLLEAGMFDERMWRCEDFDLWLRLAHAGLGMSFSREIQIGHRLANGLAADSEQMRQALIQVYEKASNMSGLKDGQRRLIQHKIAMISAAIQFDKAKHFLLTGNFGEAEQCMQKALVYQRGWKLRMAQFFIRFLPGIVRPIYAWNLDRVARRKRVRRQHRLRQAGFGNGFPMPKPLANNLPLSPLSPTSSGR